MAFKNDFVVCIKVDGKVLRELDGQISLPFNSEYEIFLKNHSNNNAIVKIKIDGEDQLDKSSIIVPAQSESTIKGKLDSSSNTAHNKFKFIAKTEKIESVRGSRPEDGIISIDVQYELPDATPIDIEKRIKDTYDKLIRDKPFPYPYVPQKPFQPFWPQEEYPNPWLKQPNITWTCSTQSYNCSTISNGITTKGDIVDQKFNYSNISNNLGPVFTFNFILIGSKVEKPKLAQAKLTCSICGTKCRSNHKFCPECGTCLQ